MDMKIILKEWNKFLVEETEKEFYADLRKKRKQRSKQDKRSTPPTPLPAGSNWDGKSAYSYNDAKGLHFFTPGIGWQTIQDRPSEPIKKQTSQEKQFKLYDIDHKTAERYDRVIDVFKNRDKIDAECGGGNLMRVPKDKIDQCEMKYKIQSREEDKIINLLSDDEEDKIEHYQQYRDLYKEKLKSIPPDFSSMG